MNLFDDAVFTGIVEHTAPTFSGGIALSGRLEGVEKGTFTLVANGAVGTRSPAARRQVNIGGLIRPTRRRLPTSTHKLLTSAPR